MHTLRVVSCGHAMVEAEGCMYCNKVASHATWCFCFEHCVDDLKSCPGLRRLRASVCGMSCDVWRCLIVVLGSYIRCLSLFKMLSDHVCQSGRLARGMGLDLELQGWRDQEKEAACSGRQSCG